MFCQKIHRLRDTEADVYHYGEHTCRAQLNKGYRHRTIVDNAMAVDMSLTPSQIQGNSIVSVLRDRRSWNEIDQVLSETTSLRKISNEKAKHKKIAQPNDGLEAIEELKLFTDIRDNLFIYEVNKNDQFVFKTSKTQMNIAKEMIVGDGRLFSDQFCFFDGNDKRVSGYVTLTASMYHTLLQKQVVLASMHCKHETHKIC